MNKQEKREAAYQLINDFFKTSDVTQAKEIKSRIIETIFDRVEDWRHNVIVGTVSERYYSHIDAYLREIETQSPSNGNIIAAYEALRKIVDLVDILKPKYDQN